MNRILRLEPASQPQNLRAEPEKLERVTYRSNSAITTIEGEKETAPELLNCTSFNDFE